MLLKRITNVNTRGKKITLCRVSRSSQIKIYNVFHHAVVHREENSIFFFPPDFLASLPDLDILGLTGKVSMRLSPLPFHPYFYNQRPKLKYIFELSNWSMLFIYFLVWKYNMEKPLTTKVKQQLNVVFDIKFVDTL